MEDNEAQRIVQAVQWKSVVDFIVNGYQTNIGNDNQRNNPFLKRLEKS